MSFGEGMVYVSLGIGVVLGSMITAKKPKTKICPDCKTEIHGHAERCPHCLRKQPNGNGFGVWLFAVGAVSVVCMLILGVFGSMTGLLE